MPGPRPRPPFRADHVGSFQRPAALIDARDRWRAGALGTEALAALEDQAIRDVVAMQERVGLRSITDGELRRWNWRDRFFETVDGYSDEREGSHFSFTEFSGEKHPGMPVPVVVGKLSRREPVTANDFAFLRGLTRHTPKATLPSPSVNHFFRGDSILAGAPYRDREAYFADVAAVYREEIADLAARGCTYLQIDEVPLAVLCDPENEKLVRERGEDPEQLIAQYVAMHNDAVRDRPRDMTLVVHLCRGNSGHGQASGGYDRIAARLFQEMDADGYFLEYDTARAGGFEPLRFVPPGRVVALGLMTTKSPVLEPIDELARRVDEAARFIDRDRLCLCPQCGFASSYRTDRLTASEQERKLAHLVAAADRIWS